MGIDHTGDHYMPGKVNNPVGMLWQVLAVANLFDDAAANKYTAIGDFPAGIWL